MQYRSQGFESFQMQYKDIFTILTANMILILRMPPVIERISKITPRKTHEAILSM
jgi:hypothetical protein